MCCNLVHANDASGEIVAPAHRALAGTVVSSLNRLKDVDNSDGGFFVFGDMSARIEGHFRLRFTLFELIEGQVVHVMSITSNPMIVHSSKTFPGMSESTFLSRSFSDQGVRIRIRKDHHVKPKRPVSVDHTEDHSPMHSPPPSSHEAEHSDSDASPPTHSSKRPKSSSGGSHRPISSSVRPRPVKTRYSSMEPTERTPPSSPGSFVGQDSAPSRPRHHPYAVEGYYDEYHRYHASRHRDPYYDYMARHHEHPSYPRPSHGSLPKDIPVRSSSGHSSRSHEHSRHRSSSGSGHHPHYRHRSSHDRGYHYPGGSPPDYYGHSMPHLGGASPDVYSHLPYPPPPPPTSGHPSMPPHHHIPHLSGSHKFRDPAQRHGFSPVHMNDHEMDYMPHHPHPPPHHRGYPERYHSRTPSMSSQRSDGGNFSPPHPFSPPESHAAAAHEPARGPQTPTSPRASTSATSSTPGTAALPPNGAAPGVSSTPQGSRDSPNNRVHLPPIHTLSTRSPVIAGELSPTAASAAAASSRSHHHQYPPHPPYGSHTFVEHPVYS
ncbi:hypothetical protein EMPS_01815 [Entomortierella parvispora]|uniref:Velvet domain-containing protein n=1 Tax=Entomortierella parvispora TaxID=205924 RepID=A0A9P3H3N6_9FUNG|nr:hypothetical protein EMPS_01815 [Entomortierella parvispora]